MSDFLWEIGCEEIPARMQKSAQKTLERLVVHYGKSLIFQGIQTFVSPRRLAVRLNSVFPTLGEIEVKHGPCVDLGETAFSGFCRTWGVGPEACTQVPTAKGMVWATTLIPKQEPIEDLLVDLCRNLLKHMVWPKRMRWDTESSWIRPIRWMLTLYGDTPLEWSWTDLVSQSWSESHRLAPHASFFDLPTDMLYKNTVHSRFGIRILSPETYVVQLSHSGVMVDHALRSERIRHDVEQLAIEHKGLVCKDTFESLVEENAGLTQWPHAVLCQFDPKFLILPPEVIITTLQIHQKCFGLRSMEHHQSLLPYFVMIADGPVPSSLVQEGYQRVVDARLSDALFFWNLDLKTPLADRLDALAQRSFFQGLGTLRDKTLRLKSAMAWITQQGNQKPLQESAEHLAMLSKCDLLTAMVGEFPLLQGVMGRYYGEQQGVDSTIARALQESYRYGRNSIEDLKKGGLLGAYLAIADGIDTLVGFFALGRIPIGSKDPMALRRTCQAVIKAMVAHEVSMDLDALIRHSLHHYQQQGLLCDVDEKNIERLASFFQDRLAYLLKESGILDHVGAIKSLCHGKNMWEIWSQTKKLSLLIKEHGDFISAYRRVYALVQSMKDCASISDFSLLTTPLECSVLALLDVPCSYESLPQWAESLNAFFDGIKVQEEPFTSARLGVLRQIIDHCSLLGPLHVVM